MPEAKQEFPKPELANTNQKSDSIPIADSRSPEAVQAIAQSHANCSRKDKVVVT